MAGLTGGTFVKEQFSVVERHVLPHFPLENFVYIAHFGRNFGGSREGVTGVATPLLNLKNKRE